MLGTIVAFQGSRLPREATARSEAPESAKATGNSYPLCLPPPRQSSTLLRIWQYANREAKSWGARRGGGPSGWKGAAAGAGVHPPAGAGAASRDNWGSGCLREGAKSYVKRLRPDRGSVSYVVIIGALVLFLWSERLRLILTKRIGLRYA